MYTTHMYNYWTQIQIHKIRIHHHNYRVNLPIWMLLNVSSHLSTRISPITSLNQDGLLVSFHQQPLRFRIQTLNVIGKFFFYFCRRIYYKLSKPIIIFYIPMLSSKYEFAYVFNLYCLNGKNFSLYFEMR